MTDRQEAINRPSYNSAVLAFGMSIGDRIRQRLIELQISESELARLAGVSQPTINGLVNGHQRTTKRLPEIAAALQLPIQELDPRYGEPKFSPPPRFLGERDLPVYAAVEGGPGEMVISTDAIDVVPRPWYLGEVRDGYAVLVVGESMIPAFDPGDMAVVNPRLPPMKNKHHILSGGDEDGDFRATIKKITGWTADEWSLEQYNPPVGQERKFKVPRRQWTRAVRVVGKYEGGG
jgi:transcriptional regulator with XRE-family HTH domain